MSRSSMALERPARRWWRRAPQVLSDAAVERHLRKMVGDTVTELLAAPSGGFSEVSWHGQVTYADVTVSRDQTGAVESVSVTTWGGEDDTLADQQDTQTIVDAFLALAEECRWPLESNYGRITRARRDEILELF